MKKIATEQLRPTQLMHGEREVRENKVYYRSLSGHDLEMAIAEKPVPYVCGPRGRPYVIDDHHIAAALWRTGITTVPAMRVRNLSSDSYAVFWLTMENERRTFPYDAEAKRRPFSELPRHV